MSNDTQTNDPLPVEKVLQEHHPEALAFIQEAVLFDPLVRAVLTMFTRDDCKLSWTASLEYLCAQLIEKCKVQQQELVKLTENQSFTSKILSKS